MEEKQLDFNAPLLSVRRFSSMATSLEGEDSKRNEKYLVKKSSFHPYKSALKSTPLRNTGAVPFLWEQIPGIPKDEGGFQFQPLECLPIAPKLPPGRILEVKQQSSDKESEGRHVIRPQNNDVLPICEKISPLDDNVTKLEHSNKSMIEKGDDDDAFTDALDTLSRTESSCFNFSVSDLSGLDDPDIKPSGIFLVDPVIRDFLMGRFLPAAKAMASETPQYASSKQPVMHEQLRQVKKVVNGDRRSPLYQYRPNVVPQYVQDTWEEESEDEDDDYDDTGNSSAKTRGLFSRLCLRNSFCLLNPVPGIKVRSQTPLPSGRKISTQVKTAYSVSHSETDDKKNWDAAYKHKLMSGLQLLEDNSKLTSESDQLTYWNHSQTDGSSSFRHLGSGVISPYRNEAPRSSFCEEMGFLGSPKLVKSFKSNSFYPNKNNLNNCDAMLSHHEGRKGSGSSSPTVEKTLYVDSVHLVETSTLNLSSSNYTEKGSEILVESRGMEETSFAVSCLQDINNLTISKERDILQPKISEVVVANLQSSSDRSNLGGDRDIMEGFRKDVGLDQESRFLMCSKMPIRENLEFDKPQPLKADDHGNFNVCSLMTSLSPPLPKLPSESWLLRTLPSICSRNDAQFHPRKQAPMTSSIHPKWETVVKTSNMNHVHLQFSEDPTTIVSQQSKTYNYQGPF